MKRKVYCRGSTANLCRHKKIAVQLMAAQRKLTSLKKTEKKIKEKYTEPQRPGEQH